MSKSPVTCAEAERAVARAHEREWATVLATTMRVTRDLDLAEDCVQDAYAQALVHWSANGVPERPGAWLTTVAMRRALEHHRRGAVLQRKLPLLIPDIIHDNWEQQDQFFPDDRLRLVFTCCHPSLAREAQVALTLRLVCGLSSAEVSKAFLVKEATMQARITRAKRKIVETRIPYRIPAPKDLPERVDAVLEVIHLVYSSGHTATFGEELSRYDLARLGLDLARLVHRLLPSSGEAKGLLALLELAQARGEARIDSAGMMVLLEDQDRSQWNHDAIREGLVLVREALSIPPISRFAIMAAIAAVHAEAPRWENTDWEQIVGLYELLHQRWPSPVVALNRAVALSYTHGLEAALTEVTRLGSEPSLVAYPYLPAARADILRRLGDRTSAIAAYQEALQLTDNAVEAACLSRRLTDLG